MRILLVILFLGLTVCGSGYAEEAISIEHIVPFEKVMTPLQGQAVRVEFKIYNAQLYAFSIR